MNEVAADYGVPHVTTFEKTAEGFKVAFTKMSKTAFVLGLSLPPLIMLAFLPMLFLVWMFWDLTRAFYWFVGLSALSVAGIWYWWTRIALTTIEVTKDAVIINNTRFNRSDFHTFTVDHAWKYGTSEFATLGYQYGNKSSPFGGLWKGREAEEVATALNRFYKEPVATTPQQLRAAQPSDF